MKTLKQHLQDKSEIMRQLPELRELIIEAVKEWLQQYIDEIDGKPWRVVTIEELLEELE